MPLGTPGGVRGLLRPAECADGPLTDSVHAVGNCGSDLGASKTILCGDALG